MNRPVEMNVLFTVTSTLLPSKILCYSWVGVMHISNLRNDLHSSRCFCKLKGGLLRLSLSGCLYSRLNCLAVIVWSGLLFLSACSVPTPVDDIELHC